MEKWRSIAAGMSCLSMLFATGAVTVSASDEITEIPEQILSIFIILKVNI